MTTENTAPTEPAGEVADSRNLAGTETAAQSGLGTEVPGRLLGRALTRIRNGATPGTLRVGQFQRSVHGPGHDDRC